MVSFLADAEAATRREKTAVPPLGADKIRRQNPHERPLRTKKSPAPLFLAATKRVREDLLSAYYAFVAAFREAAEKLKAGEQGALFPAGSFPPAMPFVDG